MHLNRKSIWMVVLILAVTAVSGLAQAVDRPKLSDEKLKIKLEKIIIPEVKFEKSDIRAALDYLRKQGEMLDTEKTGVSLTVNVPDIIKYWTVTVNERNIPLGRALDLVCRQFGGKWTVENGAVVVSQKKMYTVSAAIYNASGDFGRKLADLISKSPDAPYSEIAAVIGKDNFFSCPRITGFVNQKLCIYMVRTLPYVEETKDGKYIEKKTSDEVEFNQRGTGINDSKDGCKLSPGLRVIITLNDMEKINYITVEYLLCTTVAKEYKAIPGRKTGCLMKQETFQTCGSIPLELNKWSFMDKHLEYTADGKPMEISVLVKVNEYKPDGR